MGSKNKKKAAGKGSALPSEAVHAAIRVGASLLIALAASGPSFAKAIAGERDVAYAAWWFVVAFAIVRIAVGLVWMVWMGYRKQIDEARQAEAEREQARLVGEELARQEANAASEDGVDTGGAVASR